MQHLKYWVILSTRLAISSGIMKERTLPVAETDEEAVGVEVDEVEEREVVVLVEEVSCRGNMTAKDVGVINAAHKTKQNLESIFTKYLQ